MYSNNKHIGGILFGAFLKKYTIGENLLDVGCGELPMPVYMKKLKLDIHGIDPLKGGKRLFNFKVGVAENLPYPNNSFDNIVFATSLDHVSDLKKTLSEVRRVINPGGRVFVWNRVHKSLAGHKRIFKEKQLDNLFPNLKAKRDYTKIKKGMFFCYVL